MINLNATLIVQLINFLLLMFLLNRLLFKPMVRLLEERRARTEGRQETAGRLDGEAGAIWTDYQEKLRAARSEADRVRSELVRKAEAERQKLLDAASAVAVKNVAEIRARVQAEAREARNVLRGEAVTLAGAAAERVLGRAI